MQSDHSAAVRNVVAEQHDSHHESTSLGTAQHTAVTKDIAISQTVKVSVT